MQIRRVAAHYEEIAGHPLTEAIDSECHGETRRAYKVKTDSIQIGGSCLAQT